MTLSEIFNNAVAIRLVKPHTAEELAKWCDGNSVVEYDALDSSSSFPGVNVPVGADVKRASCGDVIFKKMDGSFDVCPAGVWRKLLKEEN